jgi:hypothetical protein
MGILWSFCPEATQNASSPVVNIAQKQKGAARSAAPEENRKMSYLPFLPPLSSFLPFFFMKAPSVTLRMAGAAAGNCEA